MVAQATANEQAADEYEDEPARLTDEELLLVVRAAIIRGEDIVEFFRTSLVEAASRVVNDAVDVDVSIWVGPPPIETLVQARGRLLTAA